jgi:adenosine deaminase
MEPNPRAQLEALFMQAKTTRLIKSLLLLTISGLFAITASAQAARSSEAHTSAALEAAKKVGPPRLYAFLVGMPKGADLHMHLSGAIYAETFLREATIQGLCIDPVALGFVAPDSEKNCGKGHVPAATILKDQHLYDALVDSFSMRGFVPSSGTTGHDQFFATFGRFGGLKNVTGQWLDEVATRAASQNEQYLEIMNTPTFSKAAALGYKIGWPQDATEHVTAAELATLRTELLNGGLKNEVQLDLKEFADAKAARNAIEHCDLATAGDSGCSIHIHFIYQILRAFPPQQVFAQTLLGFETISAALAANPDAPDVVGINFVQPEDDRRAMADYHLQMQMMDYLHSVYPNVKISLHAGELAPGMVPPEGLKFHIREAIELGHASRIGHGVDVLYEKDAAALLKEMADKHIMVEVNLTSNDGILGIKGSQHPLAAYRAAHVPAALSTDDEGVSRIDLTHEYVRAAEEQNLSYIDLKNMARTSLEHSFFQGESLWARPDDFAHRKAACIAPIALGKEPSSACATFLKSNERAREQYELERRLVVFESSVK